MPAKKSKTSRFEILPTAGRNAHTAGANGYLCALERNQNGKYNVRVRANFAANDGDVDGRRAAPAGQNGQGGWTLPVYFLASSFNAAMKKLEESLQLLQKHEERLRFWGVERTDDPNLAGELLQEFGLWLDRRREFPRKAAEVGVPRERPVSASMLAPVRRVLADSLAQERPVDRPALASD
jgi:hypothetical protein